MENATKALLIAGSVLISIIIISLLVRTYGNIGAFQRQQVSVEEAQRLEAFNKEYTKYEGQYVYGTEVITVINKALNDAEYKIAVKIKFNEGYTYKRFIYKNGKRQEETITVKPGRELNITNEEEDYTGGFIDSPNGETGSLKSRAFKCTSIEYDEKTGRVNEIKFEEKMYNGGSVTM